MSHAPDRSIVEAFTFGDTRVELRCRVGPGGLELHLASNWGDALDVDVPLTGERRARFSHRLAPRPHHRGDLASWTLRIEHLSFEPPSWRREYLGARREAFRCARAVLGLFALDDRVAGAGSPGRARVAPGKGTQSGPVELARAYQTLDEAARLVTQACDPAALAVARRFHPLARTFVYRALVGDASGRVAQLAACCPGALLFAAALSFAPKLRRVVPELVRGIVAGEPLPRILDAAVGAFFALEACEAAEAGVALRLRPGWFAPREFRGHARRTPRAALRLLVRRAGPLVCPLHLSVVAPPFFAPEDIPASAWRNHHWYQFMKDATLLCAERGVPEGTWSFFSRNAASLLIHAWAARRRRPQVDDPWAAALAYARATNDWPTRSTCPAGWFAKALSAIHDRDARSAAHRLGNLLDRLRKLELGEVVAIESLAAQPGWRKNVGPAFAPLDTSGAIVPGVELRSVRNTLELAAKGARLRNCLATRCGRLLEGGAWLVAGRVLGQPVAIELARVGDGSFVIQEARGQGNRPLTEAEGKLVVRWVKALRAHSRACARPLLLPLRSPAAECSDDEDGDERGEAEGHDAPEDHCGDGGDAGWAGRRELLPEAHGPPAGRGASSGGSRAARSRRQPGQETARGASVQLQLLP